MQPFTNTALPILVSGFHFVLMYCPGTNTVQSWKIKVERRVEPHVFAVVSPAPNRHSYAWWSMTAVCALLKLQKKPLRSPIAFPVFSKPLAVLCRIWIFMCNVVSFFLFHICFSFSAVEPFNKQQPVATYVKSNKEERWATLNTVLVWGS